MKSSVSALNDNALVSSLDRIVKTERDATLEVILNLSELEERKLHLVMGYSSLFEYCRSRLKYSEPAAYRRIKAARCIKRFPQVYGLLKDSRVSLSTICLFSEILSEENSAEVLASVSDKSKPEVERIVCSYREQRKQEVRDQIIPIRVRDAEPSCAENILDLFGSKGTFKEADINPTKSQNSRGESNYKTNQETQPEERVKVVFSSNRELLKKIDQGKNLLSGKYPKGATLEELFNEALECLIEVKSQTKSREVERSSSKSKPQSKENSDKRSRHIPTAVREQVLKRDECRCTYVGPEGVRCSSTWDLEIDHIHPFARGGPNSAGNLRVLCAAHNRFEAERQFGRGFMEAFYAQRE